MILFLLFVALLSWILHSSFSKTEITQWYNVTRPTFRKWIRYLSARTDYDAWKKKRKLSGREVLSVIDELGWPNSSTCLTKGQIKEKCETEYRTIVEMVQLNTAKLGINLSAYQRIDIFPPLISQRIVTVMG